MDIESVLIGYIIGILLTVAGILFAWWRVDSDDERKKKKWSDADFDRIFHDAWNSGYDYGMQMGKKAAECGMKKQTAIDPTILPPTRIEDLFTWVNKYDNTHNHNILNELEEDQNDHT